MERVLYVLNIYKFQKRIIQIAFLLCHAPMKNIFQFKKLYSNLFCFAQDIKNYIYSFIIKGSFILVKKKNLVLHYNVIIIKNFFPLTCLIKLGNTGTLNMQRCREKNYYYSSGSRCNKLIFALPRKIKS